MSLRNLEPSDSLAYLAAADVPPEDRQRLVEMSHGHPLALSLMGDMPARGGSPDDSVLAPDVVRALLARLLDAVPDDAQCRTLGAAALARVTTESLLRDVVGADAQRTFGWLCELSCVEAVADGVALHDVARDALEADLRWRDPVVYREVFRAVCDHICGAARTSTGLEQRRAIQDLKYLFRVIPGILAPVDWESWGSARPEPA